MNQNLASLDEKSLVKSLNDLTTGSITLLNSPTSGNVNLNNGTSSNFNSSNTTLLNTGNSNFGGTTSTVGWNTWPYSGSTFHYYYPTLSVATVSIDKVENGFVITKDGKRYVAKKAEEIVKYLKGDEK